MKPKGIRMGGMKYKRPSMGYSGVTVDMLSSFVVHKNTISETVNLESTSIVNNISEIVGVVVTP